MHFLILLSSVLCCSPSRAAFSPPLLLQGLITISLWTNIGSDAQMSPGLTYFFCSPFCTPDVQLLLSLIGGSSSSEGFVSSTCCLLVSCPSRTPKAREHLEHLFRCSQKSLPCLSNMLPCLLFSASPSDTEASCYSFLLPFPLGLCLCLC